MVSLDGYRRCLSLDRGGGFKRDRTCAPLCIAVYTHIGNRICAAHERADRPPVMIAISRSNPCPGERQDKIKGDKNVRTNQRSGALATWRWHRRNASHPAAAADGMRPAKYRGPGWRRPQALDTCDHIQTAITAPIVTPIAGTAVQPAMAGTCGGHCRNSLITVAYLTRLESEASCGC